MERETARQLSALIDPQLQQHGMTTEKAADVGLEIYGDAVEPMMTFLAHMDPIDAYRAVIAGMAIQSAAYKMIQIVGKERVNSVAAFFRCKPEMIPTTPEEYLVQRVSMLANIYVIIDFGTQNGLTVDSFIQHDPLSD